MDNYSHVYIVTLEHCKSVRENKKEIFYYFNELQ